MITEGEPDQAVRGSLSRPPPSGTPDLEELILLGGVEIEGDAGQPAAQPAAWRRVLGPDGADQQPWATPPERPRPHRQHRVGDLPRPHLPHHGDLPGHLTHGLQGRVRPGSKVVLAAPADTDADGQASAAEGHRWPAICQQHRIMQLRHHHGGDQRYPVGPGGQRAEQRQRLGVSKAIRSAEAQRRERAVIDGAGPGLSTPASRSGSITGMVMPICTTAILALPLLLAGRYRCAGRLGGQQGTPQTSSPCGSRPAARWPANRSMRAPPRPGTPGDRRAPPVGW